MNKLLLDTHVFLWWCGEDSALRGPARAAIAAPENLVYVSIASAWEIAIKEGLGRLRTPAPVDEALRANGFSELPITLAHARRVGSLPQHHRDPFDRMLIAQALIEGLVLVTRDRQAAAYGVDLLQA
jgi:PIN domain nuclease of toxin-antitoxin system